MSVYQIRTDIIHNVYNETNEVNQAYDINGNIIHTRTTDPYRKDRLLIFEDDFEGDTLNPNNWLHEVGHPRGHSFDHKRPGNVNVHNSILTITEKKDNHLSYTWSGGGIISQLKRSWINGRFEAKMKLPIIANGAFWFMGTSTNPRYSKDDGTTDYPTQAKGLDWKPWPICGEIDVIESWNYNAKSTPSCNLWDSSGNSRDSLGAGTFPKVIDTVNDWHVYAMEKTSDYIAMYIDDVEYKRWTFANMNEDTVSAYINKPIFIILGIGIGDEKDINRGIEEANLLVDWVRVYAPKGTIEPIKETSINVQESYTMRNGHKSYIPVEMEPIDVSDRSVLWISDDNTIVHCETDGFIYSKKLGETDIHCVSKHGLKATMHVTVVPPEDVPVG